MRDIRVSLLLAAAFASWGCAQGSADYTIAATHRDSDTQGLTPEVIINRRDAGAFVADAGVTYDDSEPEDDVLEPAPDDPFPVDPLPITDAAVIDPITDAALPAPPLTGTPTAALCAAGTYTGSFKGDLQVLNSIRTTVTGTLRFELPSAEGERLALTGGTLEGKDADGNPVKATIAGSIACATGELVDGKISAGTYTRPDPVFRGLTTTARIAGAMAAIFSQGDRPVGRGTWVVESELNTRSGTGSFEVQLTK